MVLAALVKALKNDTDCEILTPVVSLWTSPANMHLNLFHSAFSQQTLIALLRMGNLISVRGFIKRSMKLPLLQPDD